VKLLETAIERRARRPEVRGDDAMSTMQVPVTEVEQCPLYQLLLSERRLLDAALYDLADGRMLAYDSQSPRRRAARVIEESICRRRARGRRLRANDLSRIEGITDYLPAGERNDVLQALAACRAGCTLKRE
jgi:hypothetical protein